MADQKISTLILKVDLECYRCYKEIRRLLCKLQDRENIRTISYEEKSNTVLISGPFDPQKLSKKLRCKAGKVIKDIQIKEVKEKEKEKEKPKETKPGAPKETEKPKETKQAEPEKEKPKPSEPPKEDKKPEKEDKQAKNPAKEEKPHELVKKPEEEKPPKQEKKPEKEEKPAEPEKKPEPAKTEPSTVATQPAFESGLVCCPAPYYEGYNGGCRCCACGHIFVVGPAYGSYGPYNRCRVYDFFSEEDPSTSSCSIM